MASYRDKQNQRKMETESGRIVFAVELMDRYPELKPRRGMPADIYDGYSIRIETYHYEVYKWNSAGDEWIKIFPRLYYDYDSMINVLDAQPWQYL